MKKYMVTWGLSLIYSIIIAACAMTIASFLFQGINGNSNAGDIILAIAIVVMTVVEAVIINKFRYKSVKAKEEKINIVVYWSINVVILLIPYLFLIWLLIR